MYLVFNVIIVAKAEWDDLYCFGQFVKSNNVSDDYQSPLNGDCHQVDAFLQSNRRIAGRDN